MKRLILILFISLCYTSGTHNEEYINPNGKPFMVTLKYSTECHECPNFVEYLAVAQERKFNVIIPFSNNFTFAYERNTYRNAFGGGDFKTNKYEFQLHLPIYEIGDYIKDAFN